MISKYLVLPGAASLLVFGLLGCNLPDPDQTGASESASTVETIDASAIGYDSLRLEGRFEGERANSHGFCLGIGQEEAAANCTDLGPLEEAQSFSFTQESLRAGTNYVFWAFADNTFGDELRAQTDAPTPVITATTTLLDSIEVRWHPLPDAISYVVYRNRKLLGEAEIHCNDLRCIFSDKSIEAPPAANPDPPTNFEVTGFPDRIELSWEGPETGAREYTYQIEAQFNDTEELSNEAIGQGASFGFSGFKINRRRPGNADFTTLDTVSSEVSFFVDETTPAPGIAATVHVSQGISDDHVALSLEDLTSELANVEYQVVLFIEDSGSQEYPSEWKPGARTIDLADLEIQWQRSDSPDYGTFDDLQDAQGLEFLDTTADESGAGHYYRVLLSHPEADDLTTTLLEEPRWGFRSVPTPIFVSLEGGEIQALKISGDTLEELNSFSPPDVSIGPIQLTERVGIHTLFTPDGLIVAERTSTLTPSSRTGRLYRLGWSETNQEFSAGWDTDYTSAIVGESRNFRGLGHLQSGVIALPNRRGQFFIVSPDDGSGNQRADHSIDNAGLLSFATGLEYLFGGYTNGLLQRFRRVSGNDIVKDEELTFSFDVLSIAPQSDDLVYALVDDAINGYQICRADFEALASNCVAHEDGTITGKEIAITANGMLFVLASDGLRRHDTNDGFDELWHVPMSNPYSFTVDTYGRAFVGNTDGELSVYDRHGDELASGQVELTGGETPGVLDLRINSISVSRDNPGGFGDDWNPYLEP